MFYDNKIWIGKSGDQKIFIEPKMANRHGIIAGATGTGKTITLKVLAESFSDAGVPVFLADVKGDLAGMISPGTVSEDMQKRIDRFGLADTGFDMRSYPTEFWDIYANGGIPTRTTISEMGPLLLARLMGLNETQTDILTIAFKIADDEGLLLIDTKDLKSLLNYVGEHASEFSAEYGNIAKQSLNTVLRGIVALEAQGGENFFAEPALAISDWFNVSNGQGTINVLDCRELMQNGTMYATFLLWMLSELFETLPEVGDMDKPRMVFFFDEAHLLFKDINKSLRDKIEQVVKLIRSKGVGIFFITQNPKDIPDEVLAQLGNKIQHALRAYTPSEEKAIKAVAASFRTNPEFDTKTALMELGTGEALVSTLDLKGVPSVVMKCNILPPQSKMGSISDSERELAINRSNLFLKYREMYDRDSAYEFFQRMKVQEAEEAEKAAEEAQAEKEAAKAASKTASKQKNSTASKWAKAGKSVATSTAGTIGREFGKNIGKTIGGKFGKTIGGTLGSSLGRNILGTFFKS